jgi:glycosyltransferase involved in cell wall biosynthesis
MDVLLERLWGRGAATIRTAGETWGCMDVLFVCGREPEYIRNQVILKALRQQANVIEVTDSSRGYFARHIRLVLKLIRRWRRHDIVVVGFYGYLLVFLMRLFSRRPIIFDAYLSTYNTLCFDRRTFAPNSLVGRITFWLDKLACQIANVVVVDTRAHVNLFVQTYGIAPSKFAVLYVGCDEETFYPRPEPKDNPFRVFYYGSYLPIQGIEYIVRAAKLLEHEQPIMFQIAGHGMQYDEVRTLADELGCQNIEFIPWIPYEQLPDYIAQASICLGGHFSGSDKARSVISTKTYQFLAMAKPTIVGAGPASAEVFTHREHAYMCTMADPQALADAILTLRRDVELRHRIAWGGYERFIERYSTPRIRTSLQEIIARVYAPVPC